VGAAGLVKSITENELLFGDPQTMTLGIRIPPSAHPDKLYSSPVLRRYKLRGLNDLVPDAPATNLLFFSPIY
jgi:hypothetical protein